MRPSRIMIGLTAAAIAAILVFALTPRSRATVLISDASRAVDLILRAPQDENATYALRIAGTGHIEGEAEIFLMINGTPQVIERVTGSVAFTWRDDWYSPEATVRYIPSTAKAGSIRLSYTFSSL